MSTTLIEITGANARASMDNGVEVILKNGDNELSVRSDSRFSQFDSAIATFCERFGAVPKFYLKRKIRPLRVIRAGTEDYENLKKFASLYQQKTGFDCKIMDLWLNRAKEKMWTTVLAYNGNRNFTPLDQRTQRLVLEGRIEDAMAQVC